MLYNYIMGKRDENAARSALEVYSGRLSAESMKQILDTIKHSPSWIPYREVFSTNSAKTGLSTNAVELFIHHTRRSVPPRYKAMFDAFCTPGVYRKLGTKQRPSPKEMLGICNDIHRALVDRANYVRRDRNEEEIKFDPYTDDEIKAFKIYVDNNNSIRTAINMALLHRNHADSFLDDLHDMRQKALASDDPIKMKAYHETFMKVSDFYMKQNSIYDRQKMKLEVEKFKKMARVSRGIQRKQMEQQQKDGGAKIIDISEQTYERGKANG